MGQILNVMAASVMLAVAGVAVADPVADPAVGGGEKAEGGKPEASAPGATEAGQTERKQAEEKADPDQVRKDALEKAKAETEAAAKVPVHSFTMKTIDGEEKKLADYKGKVLLIVNTASRCGFTAQYSGLERLYQDTKSRGLEILAFPANNFGGQEPGTDSEIKTFCTGGESKYKISFPLFSKISVTGEDQHPLYKTLAAQPSPIGGDPKWNFTKFLVDRDGKVVARFESRIRPDDPELLRQVNLLLDKAATTGDAAQTASEGAEEKASAPAAGEGK